MIEINQHIKSISFRALQRLFILLLILLAVDQVDAQYSRTREFNIKAVFLYNFSQFVEWPESAFETSTSPFVIGIVGDDPFGSVIDETVSGEKVKNHPIIVQRFSTVKEVANCHMIFLSGPQAANYQKNVSEQKIKYMLTVSDVAGFANTGGMIRFMMQDNKIKLQINPGVARSAELSISSKLLRLAEIVE